VAIDISKYTKLILKIAKEGFKKGFNKVFDEKLASTIFDDLNTAASAGYGDKWIKFDPYHSPTVQQLQKNLLFFSVGKSAEQLKAMNALLIDEKGKIRNWQSFRDEVLKMNKQYNLRYLQAEYQTSKSSAQMARKWQEAQKRKHLYPNLKYLTVHDSHVREEHAKLHGIVRPIDDPWWDTHYPPNGWRCRCSAQSTRDAVTPKDKIPHVPVHKHFRHNVGKTGKIFDEKHPYFKHLTKSIFRKLSKEADNRLAIYTANKVRQWAKDNLVGKAITAKDKPKFILTGRDIKVITFKPHKYRWIRNNMLYDINKYYKESKLVHTAFEMKGRKKYKYWYYYEVGIEGKKFYLNIVMLANGEKKLHAITDSIIKKE